MRQIEVPAYVMEALGAEAKPITMLMNDDLDFRNWTASEVISRYGRARAFSGTVSHPKVYMALLEAAHDLATRAEVIR